MTEEQRAKSMKRIPQMSDDILERFSAAEARNAMFAERRGLWDVMRDSLLFQEAAETERERRRIAYECEVSA